MNIAQIIAAKRDGNRLADDEIEFVINEYSIGAVPDYQMAALAMAIFLNGMELDETVALTKYMRDSGHVMEWSNQVTVGDKHSTGGIGDKISIPLAPALAVCGLKVPMISGRGLGPTGGTLDKLESIAGFRCDFDLQNIQRIVNEIGCIINGATPEIAPADRKLYSLRDVTGTVPSIPLITASILSKKLAAGLDALVLDVKWGSGAFMKTPKRARELAVSLVEVATQLGVKTTAICTSMNQPLGIMVGNAVEIIESIDTMKGRGPSDIRQLTCELGGQLLLDSEIAKSKTEGREKIAATLDSSQAYDRFVEMVDAQHGDLLQIKKVAQTHDFPAGDSGFVTNINCERIGLAVIELGGGRKQIGDRIDYAVGLEMLTELGAEVIAGAAVAKVFCDRGISPEVAILLQEAITIGPAPPQTIPDLIGDIVTIEDLNH